MDRIDPNAAFRMKLDGKSVLKINLSKKPEMSQSSSDGESPRNRQSGMMRSRRQYDRLVSKKSAFINFYDMGESLTDSGWGDTYLTDVFDPLSPLDYWNSAKDVLLSVPSPKNTFRRVSKSRIGKYGIKVTINDGTPTHLIPSNVENSGYKPSGVSSISKMVFEFGAISPNVEFYPADPFPDYKITTSPSYSAPAVSSSLVLSPENLDIYLVPAFGRLLASTSRPAIPFIDGGASVGMTDVLACQLYRSFLDVPSSMGTAYDSLFGLDYEYLWGLPVSECNALLTKIDSDPLVVNWIMQVSEADPPIPDTPQSSHQPVSGVWNSMLVYTQLGGVPAGALVMVLRQRGNVYYVWNVSGATELKNIQFSVAE